MTSIAGGKAPFSSGRAPLAGGREAERAVNAVMRGAIGLVLLSAVYKLFMLPGPLFMLPVYDRVLPSRSLATLAALFALVAGIYLALALLDVVRLRAATRIADWFGDEIGPCVARLALSRTSYRTPDRRSADPMQDFDRLRAFIGSPAAIALCDLPWLPLYLVVAFLFHAYLGVLALCGVVLLFALAAIGDWMAEEPVRAANAATARRARLIETAATASETIRGLGMRDAYLARYAADDRELRAAGRVASDRMALFVGASRGIRLLLQSASLALGAFLALRNEITPGMIIAVSIVTARALAPVEQAIGHWRSLVAARQGWARLRRQLDDMPSESRGTRLPRPASTLDVAGLSVAAPGSERILVGGIGFSLRAGASLGVIGPNGAGKSTLARALAGVLPPVEGSIRLDGADLAQWRPDALGRHVGYLPQQIDLFDGTVAENIARLDPRHDPDAVLAAARIAGAHPLIVGLPDGYDTLVGRDGVALSAGQRQRIGLARAFFGSPFLLVLDEPTSALDAEGDEALRNAVEAAKRAHSIVVIIAHRPGAIAGCDHVLVLSGGRQTAFGPREAILRDGQRAVRVAST